MLDLSLTYRWGISLQYQPNAYCWLRHRASKTNRPAVGFLSFSFLFLSL